MTNRLRNDCFAMPPGVKWTPVRDALDTLRQRLDCVTDCETVAIEKAAGRVLAADITAQRAHPPFTNSAVDGYGFLASELTGDRTELPLVDGRAAAGRPFDGTVEPGQAIRILTGARIPKGVDCVALEEDVAVSGNRVAIPGTLKSGANCRPAGEDMARDQAILSAGRRLTAGDIGAAISVGVASATVRRTLRVGVLSTGDEVVGAGQPANDAQIYDANRPMLAAVLAKWGYEVVDIGHIPDDPSQVASALRGACSKVDAILTSGGASAGDEDHVSTALRAADSLSTWRIAIKPGRPLALALMDGVPIFGLPGNPVAAFVCTLIFARPALSLLAGGPWSEPEGYLLPATFEKTKKPGRMEFLRARRQGASVEVFKSEGSGRVSGLSWADGLVALDHGAQTISIGTPVRYLPFSEFGL